jgi:quinol-cytochrome oxidoreductase complex cytochrome b subunit
MSFIAVALWGAFMTGAVFYTQEARHPETRPLAAYLIFVTIFSVVVLAIFGGLTSVLRGLGQTDLLEQPLWSGAFLAAIFLPAFFLGRWQIKKPPREAPYPERFGAND